MHEHEKHFGKGGLPVVAVVVAVVVVAAAVVAVVVVVVAAAVEHWHYLLDQGVDQLVVLEIK